MTPANPPQKKNLLTVLLQLSHKKKPHCYIIPESSNSVVFSTSFPPDEINIYEHWMYFKTFGAVKSQCVSTTIHHESSLFCDVTRCSSVIGYRPLAKTYAPYLHRSSRPFLYCMIHAYGTETSVTNYQPTSRNITEERRAQLNSSGSLKSRVMYRVTRHIRKFSFYFLLRKRTSAGLF